MKTLWYLEAGTEKSAMIKRPALLKETFEALGRWMLVGWKGEICSDQEETSITEPFRLYMLF